MNKVEIFFDKFEFFVNKLFPKFPFFELGDSGASVTLNHSIFQVTTWENVTTTQNVTDAVGTWSLVNTTELVEVTKKVNTEKCKLT